jgi:hypothetical protein
MSSVVQPITVFHKTVHRSNGLLDLYDTGPALEEPTDLIRAAVLISIAGFDRYFTSKYCDVLIPHLKSGKRTDKTLFKSLEEAGLNAEFALELIESKRPYRKLRTIVQNSLSKHTTHRTEVIDELFLRLGLKNLCSNAQAKVKRKNLLARIGKLVELRNEIAHEGHVKVNGSTRSIDCSDTRSRIADMNLFVESCDSIINKKYGISSAISA